MVEKRGRQVPVISFSDNLKGIDQTKACRCCSNSSNRMWKTTSDEMVAYTNAGGKLDDLRCNTRVNDVPVEIKTGPPRRDLTEGARTHTTFNTCGQSVLSKCRNCARFQPVRVRVPFVYGGTISYVETITSSGETTHKAVGRRIVEVPGEGAYSQEAEPSWWNATVGGYCRIPAEGMIKDGRKVFCDPVPNKLRIENFACGNCEFLEWTDESMQFDGDVNKNARLTRYERFKIIMNTPPAEIGRALGMALWEKQTRPLGRITWHRAQILEVIERKGRLWYTLKFNEGKLKTVRVVDGDDRWEVYPDDDRKMAAVMVRYPGHKRLGLNLPMRKKVRIWPELPKKEIALPKRPPILADPSCSACKPERSTMTRVNGKLKIRIEHAVPCYFHAKAPYESPITGEIVFKHTCNNSTNEKLAPNGFMTVRHDPDGKYRAVDGNGALPEAYSTTVANAAVFKFWLDNLLSQATRLGGEEAKRQIQAQYNQVVSELRFAAKTIPMRPGWLAKDTIEANKPYCSHPDGLNFRKLWQDAFGSERVDRNFDEGDFNSSQVKEEWRTGMRSHSLTPQRLQEEMLATEISHKWYNPQSGRVEVPDELKPPEPETWTRVEIKGLGGMTDEDGNPIEDVEEFIHRLDDHVTVGHIDAADGVDGARKITKRQQLFGYTVTRGRFGKRKGFDKTSMSALDPDYVIFDYNPDEDETFIHDAWYCPECHNKQDQVEDPTNPICGGCGSPLYRNHRATGTHNPRVAGGIGVAVVPDSMRTQQQQRLWSQVCPNWILRGSNPPIGIDSLEGFDEDEPVAKDFRSKRHRIHKDLEVTVGSLTAEQKEANKVYFDTLDKVIKDREAYKEKYRETTAEELERMFPPPDLVHYKEKAVGSAAKMGGTAASED